MCCWRAWRPMAASICRRAGRNSRAAEIAGVQRPALPGRGVSPSCPASRPVPSAMPSCARPLKRPMRISMRRKSRRWWRSATGQSILLELFHGPDAGLQGYRPAGPGAVVQPRPGQARRPRHRRGRDLRRYRLGRHRGAGRVAQHQCLCDASKRPRQRLCSGSR